MWLVILAAASWFFFYILWNARFKRAPGKTVPTLVYHRIADEFDWSITRQKIGQFERGIQFLHDRGYQSADLVGNNSTGETQKKVFITFDDGYQNVYFNALPILRKFGFTACIFVVTGYVGRKGDWDYAWGRHKKMHLSWQQMEEMVRAGFSFGSHTVNHPDLTKIPRQFVRYELRKSKDTLEQKLGQKVNFVSYPFGRYDRHVEEEAQQAGYLSAYSICSNPDLQPSGFSQPRRGVYLLDSPLTLGIKLKPGPLAWIEEMKGRIINRFPDWTVVLKGSPNYDHLSDSSCSVPIDARDGGV
jgi:peptidoglycan/xylan/chitin deacetylase (PgdA/CDA1 family)